MKAAYSILCFCLFIAYISRPFLKLLELPISSESSENEIPNGIHINEKFDIHLLLTPKQDIRAIYNEIFFSKTNLTSQRVYPRTSRNENKKYPCAINDRGSLRHVLSFRSSYNLPKTTGFFGHIKTYDITHIENCDGLNFRSSENLEFMIPVDMRKNVTLNVVALTTGINGIQYIFPPLLMKLTRSFKPDLLIKPKRYLLKDITGEIQYKKLEEFYWRNSFIQGLPSEILLSSVVEHVNFSEKEIKKIGLDGIIQEGNSKTYRLPLMMNTLTSPRDESIILMNSTLPNLCDPRKEIIESLTIQKVRVAYNTMGLGAWRIQHHIYEGLDQMNSILGKEASEYDTDSIKLMLGGGNIYLMMATFFLSFLELIFSFLAFSADVKYWKNSEATTLQNISKSSLLLEMLFTIIISIYIFSERSSKLILIVALGKLFMNIWKYNKIKNVDSKLKISNEIETYENKCLWRLGYFLIIILMGVMLYQLVFIPQAGWINWMIHSTALFAYAGGFLTMTPQLFRNYKLQSVDHLAWPTLIYQGLNAFVDDFVSFIIRMPKMHRMSVFRDDVIFIIYSVQRWMYSKNKKDDKDSEKKLN